MTARALGGIARSSVSDRKVFNFAGCDLAAPVPAIFSGGGNRQRRRIHGAVGPTRYNYVKFARTYSNAAWAKDGTGTASVPSIVSETISDPEGGTTATRVAFALNSGTTLSDTSMLTQYEPSGTTAGATYTQGLWANIPVGKSILVRNVGSSAYTELTGTGQWKRYKNKEISGIGVHLIEIGLRGGLPGAIGSDSATVDLWWSTLEDGPDLTPVVPNDGGTVASTTDWPRTNLYPDSDDLTKAADGGFTGTGTVVKTATSLTRSGDTSGFYRRYEVFSAVLGREFTYSWHIPAGSTTPQFFAIWDGAHYVSATLDPVARTINDNSTLAFSHKFTDLPDGGLLVEFTFTATSNQAGDLSWGIPVGVAGTVRAEGFQFEAWHCATSRIRTRGAAVTVNTPPFGEIVTVPEGQPRIEYGPDGLGRGVKVFGSADNNIAYSGVNPGQYYYYVTEDCAASLQTMWDPLVGHFIRVTKTAGGAGPTYRAGVRQDVTGMLGPASSVGVKVRFNGAGAKGYAPYMDINDAGGGVHTNAVDYSAPPLGVWIDSSRSVNASVMVGTGSFYIWNEGPVGTSIDFAMPQCNAGNHLHEYIPTEGSAVTAPYEAIQFTDMDGFGLNQDAWTVVVEATEPTPAQPLFGTLFRAEGSGGSYVHIYQSSDGSLAFEAFNGSEYVFVPGTQGTPGTMRKYAIGIDRVAGIMRVAATGSAAASTQSANLIGFPDIATVRVGSGDAQRHINGIVAEVAVVKRLLLAEEFTNEVAL